MQGQELARFLVGILGNIISALLFFSPMPTFWRICKNKSTEEFEPYPYLAAAMNCMFWIVYGLPFVHPDSTLVITINSLGLFMEILYLLVFFCFSSKKKYRVVIFVVLLGEVALTGVVGAICLICFKTQERRTMFVGIVCVIFGIIMYAAPMSVIAKVVKTKSAEFMPFWLSLAFLCNGLVWFIYAFLKTIDPYIAIGNGIGLILSILQLGVYGYYTIQSKRNRRVQSDPKPGQVQMEKIPPV